MRTELCGIKNDIIEVLQVVRTNINTHDGQLLLPCGLFKVRPRKGHTVGSLMRLIIHAYDKISGVDK